VKFRYDGDVPIRRVAVSVADWYNRLEEEPNRNESAAAPPFTSNFPSVGDLPIPMLLDASWITESPMAVDPVNLGIVPVVPDPVMAALINVAQVDPL
jgi:hypothetical protein